MFVQCAPLTFLPLVQELVMHGKQGSRAVPDPH